MHIVIRKILTMEVRTTFTQNINNRKKTKQNFANMDKDNLYPKAFTQCIFYNFLF